MVPEGQRQVSFELPPGEYSFLRLDVDGVFPVEDITVSGQPLVKTSVRYQAQPSVFRVGFFTLFFFILAIIFQKKLPEWKKTVESGYRLLRENPRKTGLFFAIFLAFCLLLYPLVAVFSTYRRVSFQTPLYLFWLSLIHI